MLSMHLFVAVAIVGDCRLGIFFLRFFLIHYPIILLKVVLRCADRNAEMHGHILVVASFLTPERHE